MKQVITKKLSVVIAITMLFVLLLNLFLQVEDATRHMVRNANAVIDFMEVILLDGPEEHDVLTGIGERFRDLTLQDNMAVLVVDGESGAVMESTQDTLGSVVGDDLLAEIRTRSKGHFYERINGTIYGCVFREHSGLYIGAVWEMGAHYSEVVQSMLLVLLYLTVAALMMLATILRSIDALVIDNINMINRGLNEITGGKLDTKIEVDSLPEFVELSSHINRMTDTLLNTTVKIGRILDATDAQVGFFECNDDKERVLITRKIPAILAIPPEEMTALAEHRDQFLAKIGDICTRPVDHSTSVFSLPTETACYVKVQLFRENNSTFGVVMDVTEEFVEKEQLRHERDHDLLTQLYCRRAFYSHLDQLFEEPEKLGEAAMMMFDLDGLKSINDTYGHAGGDKAIRMAANLLSTISYENKVVTRLSGDEFAVFLFGASDRRELQSHINDLYRRMLQAEVTVFGQVIPVRLSGGYVFYPEHSGKYTALLRKADQALYHSKKNGKAKFSSFSEEIDPINS